MQSKKIAIFTTCKNCEVPMILGADTEAEAENTERLCDDCKKEINAAAEALK